MNPRQMAMELRVLRQEKIQLLRTLDQMRAQAEKEKSIEIFLAHAIGGFSSQPRAASDEYWQKDNTTGVMVPLDGGPKWVAEQALKTMNHVIMELEGMVKANEPAEGPASGPGVGEDHQPGTDGAITSAEISDGESGDLQQDSGGSGELRDNHSGIEIVS